MRISNKKMLRSFKTREDVYIAGYNHGIEFMTMEIEKQTKPKEPKWQDIGPRINLAGVQYSDYQLIAGGLKPGTVIDLVGEPGNPHDNKAIRVEYQKISLGYVPRLAQGHPMLQSDLWRAHNSGAKIIGVITAFNKDYPAWCMITIQCKLTYKDKDAQTTMDVTPKDVRF